jgi:hypothetical protein
MSRPDNPQAAYRQTLDRHGQEISIAHLRKTLEIVGQMVGSETLALALRRATTELADQPFDAIEDPFVFRNIGFQDADRVKREALVDNVEAIMPELTDSAEGWVGARRKSERVDRRRSRF